jgi:hypothetical protein
MLGVRPRSCQRTKRVPSTNRVVVGAFGFQTWTLMGLCPLVALSGHRCGTQQCPLLGVKRTWRFQSVMSALASMDPPRSSNFGRSKRPPTLAHFSMSSAMSLPNSAGEPTSAAGAGDVRPFALVYRVYQSRQAARVGSHDCDALGGAAGHPKRGRIFTWLRGEHVVRPMRAQEHPGRHRRQAQQ